MTQPRPRIYISSASRQQLSLIIQKYPTISAKITIRIIAQSVVEHQRVCVYWRIAKVPEESYGESYGIFLAGGVHFTLMGVQVDTIVVSRGKPEIHGMS